MWLTNKDTGGVFNTDWLDKERQIAENKKEADKLNGKLTESELKAIKVYVGMGNEINDLDKDKAQVLDSTIENKGTVTGNISVYRAMSTKELGYSSIKDLQNDAKNVIGKSFGTNGFMSTSKTLEGTGGIYAPRTVIVHYTKSSINGLDISRISERADESEVLFSRNAGYKISSIKEGKNGLEIEAEIIRRK